MAKTKSPKKNISAKKEIKTKAKKPEKMAKKATKPDNKAKVPAKVKDKLNNQIKKVDLKTKTPALIKNMKPVDGKTLGTPNANANGKALPKVVKAAKLTKITKADSKIKTKGKKPEKKEDDFEDDIVGDDFGESEIAEYEEDLKAVEEDDIDINDLVLDDTETEEKDEEIYLTDSEGRRLCKVRDCDQISNVEGYCRYHYLLLWQKIQMRKHILIDGKLEKYVEDLMARYPDKFVEVIKKDLKTEKDFLSVIQELEIDESAINEAESDEEVQSFTDEIRGIGDAPSMDDDGDF